MISDDMVDDDEDEVPLQGGVEFIAVVLDHAVAVVVGWGFAGIPEDGDHGRQQENICC